MVRIICGIGDFLLNLQQIVVIVFFMIMRPIFGYVMAALMLSVTYSSATAEQLVIMHTNDTHSYLTCPESDCGGMDRLAVLVDSVRRAEPHTLLVDAGDAVQGSLYFNLYGGVVEQQVMNYMGYDLRILGNHEFDNGADSLAVVLQGARSKFLCSNYHFSDPRLAGRFSRYDVRTVGGRRIGFLALNVDPDGLVAKGRADGVKYSDAIESANRLALWLRQQQHCDVVVALTHIGLDSSQFPNDTMLVAHTENIDVLIGGHSHTVISDPLRLPNRVGRSVLVAQTGRYARNLGLVKIDLEQLTATSELVAVTSRLDSRLDPAFAQILAPYRRGVEVSMHTPIATAAMDFPQKSPQLLNWVSDAVYTVGSALTDRKIDFAMYNIGGVRSGFEGDTVYEGVMITILPFSNRVEVIEIAGRDLLPAFTQMASIGGSGVSDQVRITYVPQPADSDAKATLTAVTIDGEPLDADRMYVVAMTDYLSGGGDYMPTLAKHNLLAYSPNNLYQDVLEMLRRSSEPMSASTTVRMTPSTK